MFSFSIGFQLISIQESNEMSLVFLSFFFYHYHIALEYKTIYIVILDTVEQVFRDWYLISKPFEAEYLSKLLFYTSHHSAV